MTDFTGITALVTAITALVVAVGGLITVIRRLTDIKHTVNSLSDKRVEEAHTSGQAQGRLSEKDDQQTRLDIRGTVQVQPQDVKVVNPPSDPVPIVEPK